MDKIECGKRVNIMIDSNKDGNNQICTDKVGINI